MSRSIPPHRFRFGTALILCLAHWLTALTPILDAQEPARFDEPTQVPPAVPEPFTIDEETAEPRVFQRDTSNSALIDRLEQAEAQIRELQGRRSSSGDGTAVPDDEEMLPSPPGTPPEPASFAAWESRFNALQAKLTEQGYPSVEVHGVFQADSGWFVQDATSRATVGNIQDGVDFRRTRLAAIGSLTPNTNYFVQMDFSFPGRPTFTDVWWEMTKVPLLGNVRVGQWKQPFGLEVVSSFRFTTFAERSLSFQAFTPFRHIALGMYDWNEEETMTWAASVYRAGQDQFGGSIADQGGYAGVGRITWLPWYEKPGDNYLHLGLGYNYVAPNHHLTRFRSIPEYFIGEQVGQLPTGTSGIAIPGAIDGTPFFVDTRAIRVNHYNLVGTELLWVRGPWSLQSEWMYMMATRTDGLSANFPTIYVQGGYFLTGEHRPYIRKLAQINRVEPKRSVRFLDTREDKNKDKDQETGWGAWELAARYSYIDLNSRDIEGGRLNDTTLGVNWYLNPYVKVQFNWIRAFLDNPIHDSSMTNIYGLRTQMDF